jgi:lipoyl(octanoyl) transferase
MRSLKSCVLNDVIAHGQSPFPAVFRFHRHAAYPSAVPALAPAPSEALARLSWRTVVTPPLDGATNMAFDAALLDRARATGEATFRLYRWAQPTISLGRNQPACEHYDRQRAAVEEVAFVRRPTGGRAVVHGRDVTYSVAAPASLGSLRESYVAINRLIVEGLRRFGVPAHLAVSRTRTSLLGVRACFADAAAGEIVAGGRKLVGSAQLREQGALLQQGSILIEDDQAMLSALTIGATPTIDVATLTSALGRQPDASEVIAALLDALHAAVPSVETLAGDVTLTRAVDDARRHYANGAWTWRR